jgi:hypothetical protein
MNEEKENIDWKENFKNEFVLYLIRNGEKPVTVFKFCEELGVDESLFYKFYNSFRSVETEVWLTFYQEVKIALGGDAEYSSYSAHEKYLSFLYAVVEVYKQNRSYVVLRYAEVDRKSLRPWFMDAFREEFTIWTKEILDEGFDSNEIIARPLISSKYHEALWVQLLYITRVWTNDESEDFQLTDAAIEKSSALLFELMKSGPVDLLIDFLKFAYQNKAY